jgi:hypothetical protein
MVDRGWKRRLEEPIPLPRSRQLITLKEAADYIMKLPKAEQNLAEWQAATEALIMAAEDRGPLMHARIGILRALNRSRRARVQPGPEKPTLGTAHSIKGRIFGNFHARMATAPPVCAAQ